jgi:2-aminoethylphosphonate-pyruvate transaminase
MTPPSIAARAARYAGNCRALVEGMKKLGFTPVLDARVQAPIIVTFHRPPRLDFEKLHEGLRRRGYVIYPGKLTKIDTFRIGCIGAIDEAVITGAVAAVADVLKELGLLIGTH